MKPTERPIAASTRFAGVIGLPARHSLSPVIHNAAYKALGLDWRYGAFEVQRGEVATAIAGARALGFVGLSVTMPHKQEAARAVEQLSVRAERLGSVNTVRFVAGVAVGESTDGDGLLDDLREGASFSPVGATCAVLGAGGAARSVIAALATSGASRILVVNRNEAHAHSAAALAPGIALVAAATQLCEAALVVNATPLGMTASNDDAGSLFEVVASSFHRDQLVVDLVYSPPETEMLRRGAAAGAATRNGLGMLVAQAARQIAWWSGTNPPRDVMTSAAQQALSQGLAD